MRGLLAAMFALGLLAAGSPASAQPIVPGKPGVLAGPDCAALTDCLRILREHEATPTPDSSRYITDVATAPVTRALQRLTGFGDEAVAPLIPLLDDANVHIQLRAAFVLASLPLISPRHAPALMRTNRGQGAWRNTAIAKTGTDEALAYLWREFWNENGGTVWQQAGEGVRLFGERSWPLIRTEMERCRDGGEAQRCNGLYRLVQGFAELPPFVLPLVDATAQSPRATAAARKSATEWLVTFRHPRGLEVLIQRLEALAPTAAAARVAPAGRRANSPADNEANLAIIGLGFYGPAAVDTGPLLLRFVAARNLPEARLAAVLAIGKIEYKAGAPALLALRSEFEDDWELAYNAVESLARLGVGEDVLRRVARDHWYSAVRNNAARGLNFQRTKSFTLPGAPPDDGSRYGSSPLRFNEDFVFDETGKASTCPAKSEVDYRQVEPNLVWPDRTAPGPVALKLRYGFPTPVPPPLLAHPAYKPGWPPAYPMIARLGDYLILGSSHGEYGGEVSALGKDGKTRILVPDNAVGLFPVEGGIWVVTGLRHSILDEGDLYFVALGKDGPVVRRRIVLPGEPRGFKVAYPRTLIINTGGPEFALTATGQLMDVSQVRACGATAS